MDTEFNFESQGERAIVYVRRVKTETLPQELRAQVAPLKTVYSVHQEDGAPLALVKDRDLAFALARQHDFAPVSVH